MLSTRSPHPLAAFTSVLAALIVVLLASDDRTVPARGKGLEAYRINSRSRCGRRGGPAFGAPAPAPRA